MESRGWDDRVPIPPAKWRQSKPSAPGRTFRPPRTPGSRTPAPSNPSRPTPPCANNPSVAQTHDETRRRPDRAAQHLPAAVTTGVPASLPSLWLWKLLDRFDDPRPSLDQRFYHHDFVPSLRLETRAANQSESGLFGVAMWVVSLL